MKAIVAMDPYRVIGYKGRIPWHIPEDFKWFKRATMDCPLLMGHSTFDSIGKPLPGRYTYILTNNPEKLALPSAELCGYASEKQVFDMPLEFRKRMWVCGGAKVYQRFLPLCDEVYVSHIMEDYEGDTYMPEFEDQFPYSEIVEEHKDFWVVKHMKYAPFPQVYGIKFVM